MHSSISPASRSLHIYTRDDGVTCENHGTDSLHSCTFDKGNKGEADQSVFSLDSRYPFFADHDIEKLMKKVIGKTEVEDALQRLDLLTKEENLTMTMARNLEDTRHFDDEATIFEEGFQDIYDNVRATQEAFCDVGNNVKETNLDVIKRDPHSVNDNVKATEPGMPYPFNFFIYIVIFIPVMCYTVTGEYQCWLL